MHSYSTSSLSKSVLSKVRIDLDRKTQRIELNSPLEDIYEHINPGNAGEVYLDVYNEMNMTGIAQYSLERIQYLLTEHCAWPNGFVNLCTNICASNHKNKITISLLNLWQSGQVKKFLYQIPKSILLS